MSDAVVGIQPSVLKWARESSGLSVDDVALSLKREPIEVAAWETGEAAPTYSQLESLAYKLYKRPLAAFFLPVPPQEPSIKKEFRTLPDFEIDRLAADTRYQLRLAHAFQISLRELHDGVNPAPRKIFKDLSLQLNTDVRKSAQKIREYLGVSQAIQAAWATADEALKSWRSAVEESGIYVFKHSFKQKDISGFCLVDDQFPVIYLNNSTSKTRQIFSLLHELAHVLSHVNAISILDESYIEYLGPTEKRVERFCNMLAAELLVPANDFATRVQAADKIDHLFIADLARHYSVSREVILRRLLDAGRINQIYYKQAVEQWAKQAKAGGGSSGGDYYATQASYLGDRYLRLVFGKHYQGKLSLEQVADYLGVRTKSVGSLEALMLKKTVST